jgi:DNA-binding response OmpR family regulator
MSGEKILVVDDSEPVRVFLESTLRGAGYAVRCAACGEDALGHCREWHPDLVLLDVLMPGMDGHMTAIEIKFDERLKDTPLLFLSADLSEESRSQGLGLGAEAYVTKPFEAGALLAKVGSILRPLGEASGPDKDLAGA